MTPPVVLRGRGPVSEPCTRRVPWRRPDDRHRLRRQRRRARGAQRVGVV